MTAPSKFSKMWIPFILLVLLEITASYARVIQKRFAPPKRIVCYYANWSIWRPGNSSFSPENIHPHLCTHLIYAYATLEREVGLVPFDPEVDIKLDGYKKFIDLKKINRDLKLILGVGGTKAGSVRFSKIASEPELRSTFVDNGVYYLRQFKFDGLDLVWKYPGFTEGSTANDKENYVKLVKELKEAFFQEANETGNTELELSMAVPNLASLLDRGFDLEELNKYLNFMSVLTYDYHSPTEPYVHHLAPIYPIAGDELNKEFNIDATIKEYLRRGADPEKLNLGIPLYGTSYQLADPTATDIGSLTEDEGDEIEPGFLIYNQLCQRLMEGNWTIKHVNRTAMGPYAYKGSQWMSFDDEDSIRRKAVYAIEHKLGGLVFWSIDQDDFKGLCHQHTYPLIKAGLEAFLATRPEKVTSSKPNTAKVILESVPKVQEPVPIRDKFNSINKEFASGIVTTQEDLIFSPFLNGSHPVKSERDVIFQNIQVWLTNYHGNKN